MLKTILFFYGSRVLLDNIQRFPELLDEIADFYITNSFLLEDMFHRQDYKFIVAYFYIFSAVYFLSKLKIKKKRTLPR